MTQCVCAVCDETKNLEEVDEGTYLCVTHAHNYYKSGSLPSSKSCINSAEVAEIQHRIEDIRRGGTN